MHSKADIALAKEIMGSILKVTLEEGIKELYKEMCPWKNAVNMQ